MNRITDIKNLLAPFVAGGDILLVVPPFGSIYDIALGPHILRALALENGYKAGIVYLNILLASIIGSETYEKIYTAPETVMSAEQVLAKVFADTGGSGPPPEVTGTIGQVCESFVHEAAAVIADKGYKIIGCTVSMSRQTNFSLALLTGIKKRSPGTITLLGGSDCRKEMAEGMATLSTAVDYIFQGESEISFVDFLQAYSRQQLPAQRIITGEPLADLDRLPLPGWEIFPDQYHHFLGPPASPSETLSQAKIKYWYETSRGCQWARQAGCHFCSEHHIPYRQKTVTRVLRDLTHFGETYPGKRLFMTDIMMPPSYGRELPGVIDNKENFPSLAYQLRIDFDLDQLLDLKRAKINALLPGIETFSTRLLQLMNKGTTGSQGLLFLRNTACVGIYADWFLLYDIPGDTLSDYEELLNLLPLLRHLQPPRRFSPLLLMRFSPYTARPGDYNITHLRPLEIYKTIYPSWADIDKLAVYYTGDYPGASRQNPQNPQNLRLIREIAGQVTAWQETWRHSRLAMNRLMGRYVIHDSRGLFEKGRTHVLEVEQAREIMTPGAHENSGPRQWALAEKLGIVLDSRYIPLVTAPPELIKEMEIIREN